MYLDLRVLKQNKTKRHCSSSLSQDGRKEVGVGEQCRTSKALSGHLGQPSVCSGCPCYLVSNRWSSVHYSLPGCWVSGWKLQKHPVGRVRGSKSHWSVTGWLVQMLPYENDFPSI